MVADRRATIAACLMRFFGRCGQARLGATCRRNSAIGIRSFGNFDAGPTAASSTSSWIGLLEAAHVKRLESLHETHPAAKRIGLLIDPAVPSTRSQLREAARKLDLALIEIDAPNPTA